MNNKIKGFTLIELLVVIAIIGILTAIVTANFSTARARARDAQRISDMANIQLALEFYFDRCNKYPIVSNNTVSLTTQCTDLSGNTTAFSDFLTNLPIPPKPSQYYKYVVDSSSNPKNYILQITLEGYNDVLINDIDSPLFSTSVSCDDNSYNYCVGPK